MADNNYKWNIPSSNGYDGSNYRICIWDTENSGVYDYSAYFSIEFYSITITSPNGSEIWDENISYKIIWETVGPIDDVKIELFDGSEFIEYLSNSTKNDGEFNWYISSSNNYWGTDYRICVRDISKSEVCELSAIFSINYALISVIYPKSSDVLTVGEQIVIEWTTVGSIDTV